MSKKNFIIPQDLLEDKTLTPTQKMILSFFKDKQKLFSLDIAHGLYTRRKIIQNEINSLVERQRLFQSNGDTRIAYTTNPNFDFKASAVDQPPQKAVLTSERSEEVRINNNNIITNKTFLEDKAKLAFKYWVDKGGMKHRQRTQILTNGLRLLEQLFDGTAFTIVPDNVIPQPLLNKRKKFDLEDWKTSIDNYVLSLKSPAHYPINKSKAISYRKRLSLHDYIYNAWAKEGSTRSMFLKCLDPPKLIHTEIARYKKLNASLTKAFSKAKLRLKPTEPQIIAVSNIYGSIIHKYEWKYPSTATAARVFIEFIETKYGKRYVPNWMIAEWFRFELENYLDRQGLINIRN